MTGTPIKTVRGPSATSTPCKQDQDSGYFGSCIKASPISSSTPRLYTPLKNIPLLLGQPNILEKELSVYEKQVLLKDWLKSNTVVSDSPDPLDKNIEVKLIHVLLNRASLKHGITFTLDEVKTLYRLRFPKKAALYDSASKVNYSGEGVLVSQSVKSISAKKLNENLCLSFDKNSYSSYLSPIDSSSTFNKPKSFSPKEKMPEVVKRNLFGSSSLSQSPTKVEDLKPKNASDSLFSASLSDSVFDPVNAHQSHAKYKIDQKSKPEHLSKYSLNKNNISMHVDSPNKSFEKQKISYILIRSPFPSPNKLNVQNKNLQAVCKSPVIPSNLQYKKACKTPFYNIGLPHQVDIIYKLGRMNCFNVISQIFSYLTPKDLQAVSSVCTSWKWILEADNKANNRRTQFLRKRMLSKENTKLGFSCQEPEERIILLDVSNTFPKAQQKLSTELPQTKFELTLQAVKDLPNKATVVKCPKCQFPSKCLSGNKYGCNRGMCLYQFCKTCLGPFQEGHACVRSMQKSERPASVIGSGKSKRNLKRL